MNYQEYLENWESDFGEAEVGEHGYWLEGCYVQVDVRRLTEVEFEEHKVALEIAKQKFESALAAGDHVAVSKALDELFPHEFVLLVI